MIAQGGIFYYVGLDIGQTRNYTAMAVLEKKYYHASINEFIASGGAGFQGEWRHRVVGLDRCSLGTPYPEVVAWVERMLAKYAQHSITLIVDATGVGSAVVDLLRAARMNISLIGTVITGNHAVPPGSGGRTPAGYQTVSRTELLTALQVAVQTKKLTISKSECREWEALTRELVLLRMEGKRAGVQDDLAFALGLSVWWGLRR